MVVSFPPCWTCILGPFTQSLLARLGTSWTNTVHFVHLDIPSQKPLITQWAQWTINGFCGYYINLVTYEASKWSIAASLKIHREKGCSGLCIQLFSLPGVRKPRHSRVEPSNTDSLRTCLECADGMHERVNPWGLHQREVHWQEQDAQRSCLRYLGHILVKTPVWAFTALGNSWVRVLRTLLFSHSWNEWTQILVTHFCHLLEWNNNFFIYRIKH